MPRNEPVQSLLRGLDLLRLISSSQDGMRLDELCAASGLKKSTAHNLVRTLCIRNFVYKDEQNRFRAGIALNELTGSTPIGSKLQLIRNAMQKLHRDFPDCILTCSKLFAGEIRCLLRAVPGQQCIIQLPSDRILLPYVSASAMLLQAYYPNETHAWEQQYPFEEYGAGIWGSKANFSAAKETVLQNGFCCRISSDTVRVAFLLPEHQALGFHFPAICKHSWSKLQKAAAEFRTTVWNKPENI